ncbi:MULTISPECIES: indole-3-glycerol phosphate synthase TrpC [Thermoanaerobacter]|uniref:Indole-3-glycerol phosphate synthase n=2 Tax=Thermoanaerobacter TaxID=1754 RepID=TRPC_THEP3|nr:MULTISPECIES: indole-3-glycerol phosphate synthase TrpC [Thermoanaerobacter]B0K8T4.1 RecName: Full=Indole-3-glycerol phosphate synthase; Short=IGPS [Thermoanaerobacter pseudethanolicus ATCC 33223]ABY94547.1 Indole-3-glycerol-phosphate synthase [Thermoanaerobacter pseudethanolicus ATCC 33223]ADV79497.1 Indole-3-glycerol-phosphate synthase [Thermoanaerobacter brockii subsp. finnii Ako-1]HBW59599.1 indole-3-glycerol-phosphate synthase [Thermoanaerobacter sp.]
MVLDEIVRHKKKEVEEKKRIKPVEELINEIKGGYSGNFKKVLQKEGISIIGEIKKASPSKGIIKEDFDSVKIAKVYEKVDVDAISVLTEKEFFKGDDNYIREVKKVSSKPILRKDFIVDEYQIYESKILGADAVLLIVSVLGDKLRDFYNLSKSVGLDVLVEIHDRQQLEIALEAGCDIIGINNRDLKTFNVDINTTENLIKYIPQNTTIVSESGIKTPEDIRYLASLGVDAVLIGETFMKIIDDIDKISDFVKEAKGGG